MITTPAELRAAQLAEREAEDSAHREAGLAQYTRFRTEAELQRLANTDAARVAAEDDHRVAMLENLAAEKSLSDLSQKDGASLFFRNVSPAMVAPAAAAYIKRGRAAQEAIQVTREALLKAVREHNRAVREIDAAALARRRAEKSKEGN